MEYEYYNIKRFQRKVYNPKNLSAKKGNPMHILTSASDSWTPAQSLGSC